MTESNTHQTSLLEWLRRQDCGMSDVFGSEREKTEKILRHREEFPSKLRDAIDLAGIGEEITNALSSERGFEPLSEPLSDRAFLSEVYREVRDFVYGHTIRYDYHQQKQYLKWSEEWRGMDSEVDTEDQVEVAIRCFPKVLAEKVCTRECVPVYPVFALTTSAKGVPFVALLANLGVELGFERSHELCRVDVFQDFGSVLQQLINNTTAKKLKGATEASPQVDEASLTALQRIRDGRWSMISRNDEIKQVRWLLKYRHTRSLAFVERRLRIIAEWDHSLLRDFRPMSEADLLASEVHVPKPLLVFFERWEFQCPFESFKPSGFDLQLYRVLVELGMSNYPKELGFAFHTKAKHSRDFDEETHRQIKHITCEELSKTLVRIKNNCSSSEITPRSLLVAVAGNDNICLDGIYTLFRSDPMAMLPDSLKSVHE